MIEKRDFYINGQWVSPAKANDFTVVDPSTEEACAIISLGDQADTDAAVAAAKAAFPDWAFVDKSEKMALLKRLLEVYNDRAEEMAQAMSMEMGAPISMSRINQVGAGSWHLEGFLKAFETMSFERDFTATEKTLLEPIGVCALITPWNWPMNQVVLKAVPAIAVGCTTVLKPSEISPLSSVLFAEYMDEAGFPAGVFNMLNGDGVGVGSQLSAHPDVDMVSFTGSSRAGKLISKSAADSLKRVSLELGGKGANIIFEDAGAKGVEYGASRCFRNSGQSCNAPTRMLVESSFYDEAVEIATRVANETKVGPASEEGQHIGPVVSEAQFDKIQGLIEVGIGEGRLTAGGLGRPDGLNRGFYVKPTVIADVTNDMTIAQEEVFGPVLAIMKFDTIDEAIAIANDTPYGLTNYIQTPDDEKRHYAARRLRSGMVETNGQGFAQGSPFGGYKQSGNGREGGLYGLEEFLEVKAVSGWTS
ncbi:aldehyde dehydrogenase family protein [Octadecabacter sp. 1_MG-2023]|uniref:aldehyde dehydrogenase family protein n=1 Tax=unclassified Octadecabacter TaxID=196158 RepID=UPI001C08CF3C|nr:MULTISPECIES: aldehyde dehydrogenase family protein [unclassified Octadecabacter]MBU2992127.1 aldehyde dehydrogenase family protein [Octadecabacter sp. B2R22]MDO6735117.1 aldehyde dehydrogenase family protein [Octadecabacter sp. 1_MG-2023]